MKNEKLIPKMERAILAVLLMGILTVTVQADIPPADISEVHAAVRRGLWSDLERDPYATSTDSVLGISYDELVGSLNQKKFAEYLGTLYPEQSCVIPGLRQTKVGEEEVCGTMVPQGICITERYILISAYDGVYKIKERSKYYEAYSHERHQSVIYVLDKNSKKYLTTIILSGNKCHVGSLAYNQDDNIVYIADSDNDYVWKLGLKQIVDAVWNSRMEKHDPGYVELEDYFEVQNRPSALCYYQKRVYVGECADNFSNSFNNRMLVYTPEGIQLKENTLLLPYYTQGVAFADVDGATYMFVSGSRGRYITSTMHVYLAEKQDDDIMIREKLREVAYPNMSEDIDIQGDFLYSCYESACSFYHMPLDGVGRSRNPVDRIMVNSVSCIAAGVTR